MTRPFPLPARLSPTLERVHAYWASRLRGAAEMPFWDDIKPADLPDLTDRLLLIDVFDRPLRFRLASVGPKLAAGGAPGEFLDEIEARPPFHFLLSQCAATVESAAPTFFREGGARRSSERDGHARLLLPMWGDGRIGMLLGVADFG